MFDVGVAFLDSVRLCRGKAVDGPREATKEAFDCALVCEGGVGIAGSEDGEEKIADFGRLATAGAGEVEGFLAKGLLRRCAVPLALKAMFGCLHLQFWMLS